MRRLGSEVVLGFGKLGNELSDNILYARELALFILPKTNQGGRQSWRRDCLLSVEAP
jgi:hypothetical protein